MDNSKIKVYDVCKNLTASLSPYDPIVLKRKISAIVKSYEDNNTLDYLMLLCHERRDYTVFNISRGFENDVFEFDLAECLYNRGDVVSIEEATDELNAWEIWVRDKDTKENFCYYLFNCSNAVIEY